jgi:hypothetical protein
VYIGIELVDVNLAFEFQSAFAPEMNLIPPLPIQNPKTVEKGCFLSEQPFISKSSVPVVRIA